MSVIPSSSSFCLHHFVSSFIPAFLPSESEVITISSDEEVTLVSDTSDDEGDLEGAASSGMHTNDEANVPDAQGRVLVNVNHPPDEPDIYLPEKIARAVKPHQVG